MCPKKNSSNPSGTGEKTITETVFCKKDIIRVVKGKYRNIVGRIVKVTEKTIFFRYMGEDGEEVEVRKNKNAVEVMKKIQERHTVLLWKVERRGRR